MERGHSSSNVGEWVPLEGGGLVHGLISELVDHSALDWDQRDDGVDVGLVHVVLLGHSAIGVVNNDVELGVLKALAANQHLLDDTVGHFALSEGLDHHTGDGLYIHMEGLLEVLRVESQQESADLVKVLDQLLGLVLVSHAGLNVADVALHQHDELFNEGGICLNTSRGIHVPSVSHFWLIWTETLSKVVGHIGGSVGSRIGSHISHIGSFSKRRELVGLHWMVLNVLVLFHQGHIVGDLANSLTSELEVLVVETFNDVLELLKHVEHVFVNQVLSNIECHACWDSEDGLLGLVWQPRLHIWYHSINDIFHIAFKKSDEVVVQFGVLEVLGCGSLVAVAWAHVVSVLQVLDARRVLVGLCQGQDGVECRKSRGLVPVVWHQLVGDLALVGCVDSIGDIVLSVTVEDT